MGRADASTEVQHETRVPPGPLRAPRLEDGPAGSAAFAPSRGKETESPRSVSPDAGVLG